MSQTQNAGYTSKTVNLLDDSHNKLKALSKIYGLKMHETVSALIDEKHYEVVESERDIIHIRKELAQIKKILLKKQ